MATILKDANPGTEITIKEGAQATTFVVLQHNFPTDNPKGTLVWRKTAYGPRAWNSNGVNTYAGSDIDVHLNTTYLNLIDSGVRKAIIPIGLKSLAGNGDKTINTITRQVFILSFAETWGSGWGYTPMANEGAMVPYLKEGRKNQTFPVQARAYDSSGAPVQQWMRTPYKTSTKNAVYMQKSANPASDAGGLNMTVANKAVSNALHVKPAFVLPSTLEINSDGTVITNSAPSTPGKPRLPDAIGAGSNYSVSWGASTDPDGNLSAYVLERSLDGGGWQQRYLAAGTGTTDSVSYGVAHNVQYRVKARDREGAESAWAYSDVKDIINNRAPGQPPSITVPATISGGSSPIITWSAAVDADGNLSGYELEQQADGGSWTRVYSGASQTAQVSVTKGWKTVAYRIRAKDTLGAYSLYTTSETRTVDNNTAPSITSGAPAGLGMQNTPFGVDYTVNDDDGDAVTVLEAIDGKKYRTYTAASGEAQRFEFDEDAFIRILNGEHTMTITATDSRGASSVKTMTFTKAIHEVEITLKQPRVFEEALTKGLINLIDNIPDDAIYTIEVTNNALDENPVWQDITEKARYTSKFEFVNQTAANGFAFNFRIRAKRGESGEDGYIKLIGGAIQ